MAEVGQMAYREIVEWQIYDGISPIGPERADLQAALSPYVTACVNRGKGATPKFEDFVLEFGPKKVQTNADMEAMFMEIAHRHNAMIGA